MFWRALFLNWFLFKMVKQIFTMEDGSRTDAQPHTPTPRLKKKIIVVCFCKLDCITRIWFNYCQHAMFTICIYSLLSLWKDRVYVKGHQNNPETQKFYLAGPATPFHPVLKLMVSPPTINKHYSNKILNLILTLHMKHSL